MEEFEDPIIIGQPTTEAPIIPDTEFEDPIFLGQDTIEVSPAVPQGPDNSSFVDLDNIFKEYGRKLTKEDIVEDDRLMEVVRSSLEARFTPRGVLAGTRRTITGLSGGTIGGLSSQDYREMDNNKVFETWQNYQRSFAGGQTVTTANELAYGMGADDTIKSKLGAGYLLFDQMDNAFTGEGSWPEMGDAIWDYGRSAVYDPSTILSLGLGKLISFGATRSSTLASKALMKKAYQNQIKKGVAKATAIKAVGESVKKALPYATADALIGAGVDVAYQAQLIGTEAQEEYSKAETALAAAGALVIIPSLVAIGASVREFRKSELAPQFMAYKEMDKAALELGAKEAKKLLDERVNKQILIEATDDNFGIITGDSREFLNWEDIKVQSEQGIEYREEEVVNPELLDSFFKRFWFGDEEEARKGYYQALKEAGFVVHSSMLEDNTVTGVFGQAIEYLSDEAAEKAIKNFEKSTGQKLGIEYSAAALAENFIQRTSTAGSILWTPSQISRLEKLKVNPKDAAEILGGKRAKPEELPARNEFTMSVYKRLLTSHLATTGANIKGFTQLVSLNTAADIFTAAVNLTQVGGYKLTGNVDKAEQAYNRAYGSLVGAARRGLDVISPDIPMEYADAVLALNPEVVERLFRDISGDGGVRDGIKDFNLDKTSKGEEMLWRGVNNVTKGAQTLTLVRLQDDLTKRWAFGTNMNQAIMRAYGETPEKFFARKDVGLEMASAKFQEEVLDKAVFRTMRETASVNWSSLPGKEAILSARSFAKGVEFLSNRTPLGFVVPFGSFLNTTVATMSDLTGINAMRFAVMKMSGKELDFATREGAEALGKMAAGWSAIGLGVYGMGGLGMGAKDRIENNLAYNQEIADDGSVRNIQYDWPSSTMRLMSQIIAHGMGDSNSISDFEYDQVPTDLMKELGVQLGAQAVRDLDEVGQVMVYAGEQLIEGNPQPLLDSLAGFPERIAQGVTRPIDPINQIVGMASGANMNPDIRQGAEFTNQATRYLNNILGTSKDLPRRATPTSGTEYTPDIGKQILGARTLTTPNLIQKMMNSAGQPYWKAIRFDGPPEIKNTMDNLAEPFFEAAAIKYLKKNPDYFRLDLEDKEKILSDIRTEVKENVKLTIDKGMPKAFNLVRVLSGEDKEKVREIMDFLSIEGEVEDLLKDDDGLQQLLKIQTLLKYYDDIKFQDLTLD